MRPVVLYLLVSLDGVAEAPSDWLFDFDEVMESNLAEVIGHQDAVLLGRRQYEEWADYWPTATDEPFAGFINRVPKYVFTSSALDRPWTNVTAVTDLPATIASLRATEGGAIGVHGSIELTQAVLRSGLADELHLVVAPTTAGSGRRLFGADQLRRWSLARSVATPSGSLLLHYRPATGATSGSPSGPDTST